MKRKVDSIRTTLVSMPLALLVACAPLDGSAEASSAFDRWVAKYINKDEKLLCKNDKDGEFFFLARLGDTIKIGSRLNVTQAPENNLPKAFIVAWKFQNEKGEYLATKVPPTTVKEGYVRDGSKIFSEQIEYQTLYLKGSEKMRVTIDIKKCPTVDCDRQLTKSKDEKEYSIMLCEATLN